MGKNRLQDIQKVFAETVLPKGGPIISSRRMRIDDGDRPTLHHFFRLVDETEKAQRRISDIAQYVYSNLYEASSIAWYLFTGQRDAFCPTPDYIKSKEDARKFIDEWNSKIDEVGILLDKYSFFWYFDFVGEAVRDIRNYRFDSFEQAFEKVEDL